MHKKWQKTGRFGQFGNLASHWLSRKLLTDRNGPRKTINTGCVVLPPFSSCLALALCTSRRSPPAALPAPSASSPLPPDPPPSPRAFSLKNRLFFYCLFSILGVTFSLGTRGFGSPGTFVILVSLGSGRPSGLRGKEGPREIVQKRQSPKVWGQEFGEVGLPDSRAGRCPLLPVGPAPRPEVFSQKN